MVREAVQELYGPALKQIGRPEFHKPYPDYKDVNNPYPRGYRVHDFSLFSGEDGQYSMEHIARFTIQCGELANLENFNNLNLRQFQNSLTGTAFALYASLPRNSMMSWQEMERQFHIQFYIIEPEVCIVDLSRVTQKKGESVESFIDRFKKMKNICKFRDFFELAAKVAEYEELLREESYKKKTAMESYYQEVEDVALEDIRSAGSCTVPLLKKKPAEPEKKNSSQIPKDMQYTFDVSKIMEVFDFLVKEKFITFPPDHRMPPTEELKGREYCKYHNSYNHATKSCWAFKNILQDIINKGVVKFPNKQESIAVDDDPFSPINFG
ncbi:uncharacterized protein LOC142504945 [Primulina tabacum]|uniref:uncharacterized protein LOC142504945 n=1 Tax=Primulina tabacum TaxID=48773 RepID=UPI003F5A202C